MGQIQNSINQMLGTIGGTVVGASIMGQKDLTEAGQLKTDIANAEKELKDMGAEFENASNHYRSDMTTSQWNEYKEKQDKALEGLNKELTGLKEDLEGLKHEAGGFRQEMKYIDEERDTRDIGVVQKDIDKKEHEISEKEHEINEVEYDTDMAGEDYGFNYQKALDAENHFIKQYEGKKFQLDTMKKRLEQLQKKHPIAIGGKK